VDADHVEAVLALDVGDDWVGETLSGEGEDAADVGRGTVRSLRQ
jgi:hypothetical protein